MVKKTTNQQTTTPQLEALRKGQAKKRSTVDPSHILDKAIYQLWETINDLDQIQPERVEHYRVSVFGSSRIQRGDPITTRPRNSAMSWRASGRTSSLAADPD